MERFIKTMIESASKTSIEEGQGKYRKYFIYTKIYKKYKEKVDSLLIADGYEEVIVTE